MPALRLIRGRTFGRLHLYGDVYSSPGLKLRQKQVLMCAFLAEADMHEQLFGHLIAVSPLKSPLLRFRYLWASGVVIELSIRAYMHLSN